MIGVAQDDLGMNLAAQFRNMHTLDAALCAHGHKYGSFDDSVVGDYASGACLGRWGSGLKRKVHR